MRALLLALICSMAAASPAPAQRWVLTASDGESFRHLDESRVAMLDPFVVRVWTRLEGIRPIAHASVRGGLFRVMITERDVDCWEGAWRVRQRVLHADDGALLFADATIEGWRFPYPGTTDHAELIDVCRRLLGVRYPYDRYVAGPVYPPGGGAAPPAAGTIPRAVPTPPRADGIPPKRTPGTRRTP